jgi:hypothetical protein
MFGATVPAPARTSPWRMRNSVHSKPGPSRQNVARAEQRGARRWPDTARDSSLLCLDKWALSGAAILGHALPQRTRRGSDRGTISCPTKDDRRAERLSRANSPRPLPRVAVARGSADARDARRSAPLHGFEQSAPRYRFPRMQEWHELDRLPADACQLVRRDSEPARCRHHRSAPQAVAKSWCAAALLVHRRQPSVSADARVCRNRRAERGISSGYAHAMVTKLHVLAASHQSRPRWGSTVSSTGWWRCQTLRPVALVAPQRACRPRPR